MKKSEMDRNEIPLLSNRLKELLSTRKITQVKLAHVLGYDKDYINQLLRRKVINKPLLIKISEYLDCHPGYLTDKTFVLIPFATYKGWSYDYDYCVRGLLHMKYYSPAEFTDNELSELKDLIGALIEDYAIEKRKAEYSPAAWDGPGDRSGTAEIVFKKKTTTENQ